LHVFCAEKATAWGKSLEYMEKLLATLLAEEPLAALRQKIKPAAVSAAGMFGVSKTENENNEDALAPKKSLSH
jgi:hypothetical protein